MSRENDIRAQMIDLGIYRQAFDPVIHKLCIQERELSRAMKAWKASSPNDFESPLYAVILKQRDAIAKLEDRLGLSPKALKTLQRQQPQEADTVAPSNGNAAFSAILDKIREAATGEP